MSQLEVVKKKYVLPIPDLKLTAAGGPGVPSPPPEGVGEGPEGPLFVFKPATTAVSPLFVPVIVRPSVRLSHFKLELLCGDCVGTVWGLCGDCVGTVCEVVRPCNLKFRPEE